MQNIAARRSITHPQQLVQSAKSRFWELDALRGVAIVMMVIYHFMWDLLFFGVVTNVALQQGFWKYFQRTTASTFILLVGVALVVSYQQDRARQQPRFRRFLQRGLRIFGWGLLLSIVVRVAEIGRLDFGVLHLIGISIILSYPLLRFRWLNIGLWVLFNVLGYLLQSVRVGTIWLVWLGLKPVGYSYLDYFPLIPWFGVVLLGIGIGNLLYANGQRTFTEADSLLPKLAALAPNQWLQWLGRRSLMIYLLHQPILFAMLYIIFLFFSKS